MGPLLAVVLLSIVALLHSSSDDVPPLAPAPVAQVPALAPAMPHDAPRADPADLLADKQLLVPVEGVQRTQLRDTFHARRGNGRTHEAIDIMAAWGTPVLAADDGIVAKISSNRAGGLVVFQVDPSGRFVYYYAHLAGYPDGLREGQPVNRGDVIGFVGATGNATTAHLHFAVMMLAKERRWWGGEAINPFPALAREELVAAQKR